jgi:predicted CoA-binding protein
MLKKTLVLGASEHSWRYSSRAIERLLAAGHEVVAIGKRKGSIHQVKIQTLADSIPAVHTVSIYLNARQQKMYYDFLVRLKPQRVIFNPGTENPELEQQLEQSGIKTIRACTLVMLSTGQY